MNQSPESILQSAKLLEWVVQQFPFILQSLHGLHMHEYRVLVQSVTIPSLDIWWERDVVSSGRVGGSCENTAQSNSQRLCNGHHLKCCVDVNCQYNYMSVLEVVSLFLYFIDVTSLTRYGDSDGV